MKSESLYRLAGNQLLMLKRMAAEEGDTELEQQLHLFFLSLQNNNEDTPEPPRSAPAHAYPQAPTRAYPQNHYTGGYEEEEDGDYYDYDDSYEDDLEDYSPIPEGFNSREEYQNFLDEQAPTRTLTDPETGETVEVQPDTVAGVVPDEDTGEYKEVGNFEEDLDRAHDLLEEGSVIRDEETGEELYRNETEEVPVVEILFTRNDGEELTVSDLLNKVFSHPQAQPMLKAFGENYVVTETEGGDHQKSVAFAIEQNTTSSSVAKLLKDKRFLDFGGRIIVPGVGQVVSQPVFAE